MCWAGKLSLPENGLQETKIATRTIVQTIFLHKTCSQVSSVYAYLQGNYTSTLQTIHLPLDNLLNRISNIVYQS